MTRGWCIGGKPFKRAVTDDLLEKEGAIRLEAGELKEFNRAQWESVLESSLKALGKSPREIASSRRSERWKVAIAAKLKRETSATNAWIAEKLCMGVPNAVSDYCGKYARKFEGRCPISRKLKTER